MSLKHLCMKILLKGLKITAAVLITYAIIFSLAGTIFIGTALYYLSRPVVEVKKLITHNPAQTAFMRDVAEKLQQEGDTVGIQQIQIPLDSISGFLKKAVVAAEDDGFYLHPGFDIAAILSAIEVNQSRNRIKHGASTITQQVAKNFFLSEEKSFSRKYRELLYAVLLETFLGKDRILELYLNYAQWGKNIFGCEAAARQFYGKSSSELSQAESIRLAAVLSMPSRLTPWSTSSSLMGKRVRMIAENLYRRKLLDDSAYVMLCGFPPPSFSRETENNGTPEKQDSGESGKNILVF